MTSINVASQPVKKAVYTHGHHASVLRSHTWRTAINSCGYLLPHIRSTQHILDIGCGPGTITLDFAKLVPQGHVTGIDSSSSPLDQATALAQEQGINNVKFQVGDGNNLQFGNDTFDIVHCHQVLQHVGDPIHMLKEMKRVTKPGGIVAARECDVGGFITFPNTEDVTKWWKLYCDVTKQNGGEPFAGRYLKNWVHETGFDYEHIQCSASSWCFSTREETKFWGNMWAERIVSSNFSKTAIEHGLATMEELEKVAVMWKDWGQRDDAWFGLMSAEVICVK